MLVLTRKPHEAIIIGDHIEVKVLSVDGEKVRIGIRAPREIPVYRLEIYLEIAQQNAAAGARARSRRLGHATEPAEFVDLAQHEPDGLRDRGVDRRAEAAVKRWTSPTSAPMSTTSGGASRAARRVLTPSSCRLNSPLGVSRSPGTRRCTVPTRRAGPHGIDDHRLGAALEVAERVQARRAGVERRRTGAAGAGTRAARSRRRRARRCRSRRRGRSPRT